MSDTPLIEPPLLHTAAQFERLLKLCETALDNRSGDLDYLEADFLNLQPSQATAKLAQQFRCLHDWQNLGCIIKELRRLLSRAQREERG